MVSGQHTVRHRVIYLVCSCLCSSIDVAWGPPRRRSALHDVARELDPAGLGAVKRVAPTHLQLWNYQPKKGVRIGW